MRMIIGLIVIFGLVLVSEAKSNKITKLELLVGEQSRPSEELTRDKLLEVLDNFAYNEKDDEAITKYVSAQLYKTGAKEDTEVMNGVTVAELIAQNEFRSLKSECTRDAFRRRAKVYAKTRPTDSMPHEKAAVSLNVYALKLLRSATNECHDKKWKVVQDGINDRVFMQDLWAAYDEEVHVRAAPTDWYALDKGEYPVSRDVASAVNVGNYSPIAEVIDKDAKNEWEGRIRG